MRDFDDEAPLTPAMLMGNIWHAQGTEWTLNDQVQITQRVVYAEQLLNHLKQRWEKEYLAQLCLFYQQISRTVKVGDGVYVEVT